MTDEAAQMEGRVVKRSAWCPTCGNRLQLPPASAGRIQADCDDCGAKWTYEFFMGELMIRGNVPWV